MSVQTQERGYTSRWKPQQRERHLTERDIEVLRLLTRYTYLTAPHFQAFLGGNMQRWRDSLKALTGAGYVERPHQQQQHFNANYRPLVYSIGKRGINALEERGIEGVRPRAHRNFAHELMTCELMASLELGAKETGTRLIAWPDILASGNLPKSTVQSPRPYALPITYNGKPEHIMADGQPFGVQRVIDDQKKYLFCPGVEADCGTEPIDTSDFERSSIFKKFTLYLAVIEERIYRSHFDFPNLYIPIITTTKVRRRSMMELLERMTQGKGSKNILFAPPFPAFTSFEKPQPPSGFMLTQDYDRVGHAPFNFLSS